MLSGVLFGRASALVVFVAVFLSVASAQDDHDGLVAVPNPIQISGIVCESSRGQHNESLRRTFAVRRGSCD